MDIALLGYKLNVEILILIGVVYLILVGHMFCSCCSINLNREGMTTDFAPHIPGESSQDKKNKEGFVGANTNYGESSKYSLEHDPHVNTSNWSRADLVVKPGQPLSKGVKEILNRKPQPVPLPKGELLMFANTPFKPDCCPNAYSNSMGCACMTTEQYNYLILRGGNNVPYSEY
jgi:hypothetical protein